MPVNQGGASTSILSIGVIVSCNGSDETNHSVDYREKGKQPWTYQTRFNGHNRPVKSLKLYLVFLPKCPILRVYGIAPCMNHGSILYEISPRRVM